MFESLSDTLQNIFSKLKSKGRLSEADIDVAMKEIRMTLLEADVNFHVVKTFCARTKQRCMQLEVLESLTPGQNVIKIVLDEMTKLLGTHDAKLNLGSRIPAIIMLVGLQGAGKTTAAVKLAYHLRAKHKPLLVACDLYRPAAAEQLKTLGAECGLRVYCGKGKDAAAIAKEGVADAIASLCDLVIIDTAGRLHVDKAMMDEAAAIRDAVSPAEILMVVDAMTGQDAVNAVSAFAAELDFDGVIMSKMDGDARGGAALSLREVTGKPIKFISVGEKPSALEAFHPERMAKRILGMGDVVSLIEKAVEVQNQADEHERSQRLARAEFSFNDFYEIIAKTKKMGGLSQLAASLPGGNQAIKQGRFDEHELDRIEALINSMTPEERLKPQLLNGSRRLRIARGSGLTVQQLNQLVKRFNETRNMIKKVMGSYKKHGKKKLSRRSMSIPGLGQIDPSLFKGLH